jgi:hypothetical protein
MNPVASVHGFMYHPHTDHAPQAAAYLPVDWEKTALNAAANIPYLALADARHERNMVRRPSQMTTRPQSGIYTDVFGGGEKPNIFTQNVGIGLLQESDESRALQYMSGYATLFGPSGITGQPEEDGHVALVS